MLLTLCETPGIPRYMTVLQVGGVGERTHLNTKPTAEMWPKNKKRTDGVS